MVAAVRKKIVVPPVIGEAKGGAALGPVSHLLEEGSEGRGFLGLLGSDATRKICSDSTSHDRDVEK
jgi:hypothetical protein